MAQTKNFFFTYGTDGKQPFCGGWTVVAADSLEQAVTAFKAYHPSKNGILSCSDVYGLDEFEATGMKTSGNFGAYAHELIVLQKIEIK